MTDKSNDVNCGTNRKIIIDAVDLKIENLQHNQQMHNNHHNKSQKQWPLEALSIRNAVLEYGRRTASIQALASAKFLQKLSQKITNLSGDNEDLKKIANDCLVEANRLRATMNNVYYDNIDR